MTIQFRNVAAPFSTPSGVIACDADAVVARFRGRTHGFEEENGTEGCDRRQAQRSAEQEDREGRHEGCGRGEEVTSRPPWLFPVPVRRSQFDAFDRAWAPYNVEVALDRIDTFAFDDARVTDDLLYCDYHAQLEGNGSGRLGSGRSGVYSGFYLKGVGRTLAAANWSEPRDRYHGSGHLSVGSALRERLITEILDTRGLGRTIVPCEAVLLRPLAASEARAVRAGASSSIARFTPADARFAALTVKPADFARMGNIVFALTYFDPAPQWLGRLFLHLDRYLRPPGARARTEGAPAAIVDAMDAAFRRGFAHFQALGRAGLLWVSTVGNVALDGRVLDLETPHFFGAPFLGLRIRRRGGTRRTGVFLGFEELAFAGSWRRFLAWFVPRLEWMNDPGIVAQPEARTFLAEFVRAIRRRFSQRHLLYRDAALAGKAVDNLQSVWNLSPRDERRLGILAGHALRVAMYSCSAAPPAMAWRRLDTDPAPPTPTPFRFEVPAFLPCGVTPDARRFAADIASLGAETDERRLLRRLSEPRLGRER